MCALAHVEIREQLTEVCSGLSPCGLQGSNLDRVSAAAFTCTAMSVPSLGFLDARQC